jgi:RNA polymerase sigma factor (sigma-70 family)
MSERDFDTFGDSDSIELPEDEGRDIHQFYVRERRREQTRRRFRDEKPELSEEAAAEIETLAEGKQPAPSKTRTKRRIPREEFGMLVTRATLGDEKARDELITLTHDLGHSVLAASYDEETRYRAIIEVTDKLFTSGMLGLGIALYFDLSRAGALVSFLTASLKNAAVDELRKKTMMLRGKEMMRDALDISVPYSVPSDEDESEYSPALMAQRLGNDEDGTPIIPGADSIDPLRQLEGQKLFEAVMRAKLTPRQCDVADLLVEGRTDVEISEQLDIKPSRARALIAEVRGKIRAVLD